MTGNVWMSACRYRSCLFSFKVDTQRNLKPVLCYEKSKWKSKQQHVKTRCSADFSFAVSRRLSGAYSTSLILSFPSWTGMKEWSQTWLALRREGVSKDKKNANHKLKFETISRLYLLTLHDFKAWRFAASPTQTWRLARKKTKEPFYKNC